MAVVLVTGSTGNVGREVLAQLELNSVSARALSRESVGRPAGFRGSRVIGDLGRIASMRDALDGATSVFLIWPRLTLQGAPELVAALAARKRRVVYLSSVGVVAGAATQSDPINQVHADMERLLEGSLLDVTVLRSSTIASNTRGWSRQIRETGVVRGPSFPAAAVVDERDIAEVAARVLVEDGPSRLSYALTGPAVLNRSDQAAAIGRAIGREVRYVSVTKEEARRQLVDDGRPVELVDALLASADTRPDDAIVTSTVRDLTGHPARAYDDWAVDHADLFRE